MHFYDLKMHMENREVDTETKTMLDVMNEKKTSMRNKLRSLSISSEDDGNCSIYKIPEFIRKENEETFQPLGISIGPIFYGDPALEALQEKKWNFLKCFLDHPSKNVNHNLEFYFDTLGKWEKKARGCYQAKISLSIPEFIEMMLLDAAFLIYLFMWAHSLTLQTQLNNPDIGIPRNTGQVNYLDRDLFLLENQLPFFILKDLHDLAFGKDTQHISFDDLTCFYISTTTLLGREAANNSIACKRIKEASNIKHLVDFWRICCLPSDNLRVGIDLQYIGSHIKPNFLEAQYSFSAKELRAAGVKFVAGDSKNPLDIKFSKNNGVLEIPKFIIQGDTESTLQSILFFEQCHYINDSYLNDYIYFIGGLIESVEDVQILVRNAVLINFLKEEEVVECFKKTNAIFSTLQFYYKDVLINLNGYTRTHWNQYKALLRGNYFQNIHHPWAIISIIYATILFTLTLLQTIAGFITK